MKINLLINIVFWWWMTTAIIWLIRNPLANTMTIWTRLPHVVSYHKMAEYQVVETQKSIGRSPQYQNNK